MALSLETLKERWDHSLMYTDDVICRHPDVYKELKSLVCKVNHEIIDVGQYSVIAKRIAFLLDILTDGKTGTLLDYFSCGIDPKKNGTACYFRFFCMDLQNLLNQIDSYRRFRRSLKIIK